MVPLIAVMCSGIYTTEKNVFQLKKVFDKRFFAKIFILQQCLNPNPNPNFFRIWIRIRIQSKCSDSDPQHWFL
jgi:hypothetical protein